jgi:REP element-mobilizing transposase RayT
MNPDNLPVRRFLQHEAPHWVREWEPYFVTICCIPRGKNQLCVSPLAEEILESVKEGVRRQIWSVDLVLLMPDHLHGIFHFNPAPGLKIIVANWKKLVARRWKVEWQRDFFDHRLRNDREYSKKFAYVRNNPVRAGLAESVFLWPYQWPRPIKD